MSDIDEYLDKHFDLGGDDDDDDDENHVYNANELLVGIMNRTECISCRTVVIVPRLFWEENGCMDDSIGGYNINELDLVRGGICGVELCEGVFEFLGNKVSEDFEVLMYDESLSSITNEEIIEMVTNAGFEYSEEVTNFINRGNDNR